MLDYSDEEFLDLLSETEREGAYQLGMACRAWSTEDPVGKYVFESLREGMLQAAKTVMAQDIDSEEAKEAHAEYVSMRRLLEWLENAISLGEAAKEEFEIEEEDARQQQR